MAKKSETTKKQELFEKRKAALAPFKIDISQEIVDMTPQKFTAYLKKLKETTQKEQKTSDKEQESLKTIQESLQHQVDVDFEKARKIMAQMNVCIVYLTTDGYWFTQE